MSSPKEKPSRMKFSEDAMLLSLASEAEKRLAQKRRERKEAKAAILHRQDSIARKDAQKFSASYKEAQEVEKAALESRMNVLLSGKKDGSEMPDGSAAGEKLLTLRQQLDFALQSKVLVESSKSTLRFTIEDLKDKLEEKEEELSQAHQEVKIFKKKFQQEEGARLLMEKTIQENQREARKIQDKIDPMENEIDTLKKDIAMYKSKIQDLQDNSAAKLLNTKLASADVEKQALQIENEKLKDQNHKYKEELDHLKEQMKNMTDKGKGGGDDAIKLRAQLEEEGLVKGRLERQVTKLTARIEQLEKDLAEAETQTSELKTEKRKLEREKRQIQTQLTEATTELNIIKIKK